MPSVDSTGKRLSGGATKAQAQRHRATRAKLAAVAPELAAALPEMRGIASGEGHPAQPMTTPPPPVGKGLDELISWAARIQARAALMAEQGQDPERVRAIGVVVKALAKIKHAAADSERACAALRRFRGVSIDYDGELPPADDIGLCVWAAWRLGALLHSVCISMDLDEGAVQHRARTLSLLEQVQPQAAIDRVAADLADESGA